MTSQSPQVSFVASRELLHALDIDAYTHNETRSARIRRILAGHLRDLGLMDHREPETAQMGDNSDLYRLRGGRR